MGFMLQLLLGLILIIPQSICDSKEINNFTTASTTTEESSNRDINKLIIKNDVEKKSKSEQPDKISPFNNFENDTDTKEKTPQKNDTLVDKKNESIRVTSARAMDVSIEKYLSEDFHNKNNVYTLPDSSSSIEKLLKNENFDYATTEHSKFEIVSDLTTPHLEYFDQKYKETVDSVAQNLDHHYNLNDDGSLENISEEKSIESLALGNKNNGTKIEYVKTKNVQKNQTADKNAVHKDLVIEQSRHINIEESFNDKQSYEDPSTTSKTFENFSEIVSQHPVDSAESFSESISRKPQDSTAIDSVKNLVLYTTEKNVFTKPPHNKNNSHILSNNIETDTIKAISSAENIASTSSTTPKTLDITTAAKNELSESKVQENQILPFEKTLETTQRIAESTTSKRETNSVEDSTVDTKTNPVPSTTLNVKSTEDNVIVTETSTLEHEISTVSTTTTDDATATTVIFDHKLSTDVKHLEDLTTIVYDETTTNKIEETSTVVSTAATNDYAIITEEPKTTTIFADSTTDDELSTTALPTSSQEQTTIEIEMTTLNFGKETSKPTDNVTKFLETTEYDVRTSKAFSTATETSTNTEGSSTASPDLTSPVPILSDSTEVTDTSENAAVKEHSSSSTEGTTEKIVTTEKRLETTTVLNELKLNKSIIELQKNAETTTPITEDYTTNESMPTEDELTKTDGGNKGTVAAIAISTVGAVCLVLLAGLLYVMRKRQKRFNYGPRCTPVSLDEYSIDNMSVYNSVSRRKAADRRSKRSYGNPAFEDPTAVTHPLNFPALAKFAKNFEDIKAEFEEIPQINARTSELPEGCETKNRYANVIPLPETRVFLKKIDGYPNSDYINANYVTGPKNVKGYYIATQAPMENTVDDFWRMIWEQQCKVILMVTQHFENGLEKCVDYLPPSEVTDCHRLFGDFQITLKKREVKEKYIISSLQLKNMVSNSWREVTHFWYIGWPDKGVPTEANSLIAYLIEARSYMKSATLDNKIDNANSIQNGAVQNEINPVVVHCSPGTGRTGVVLACDIAIREFEKSRLVDLPKIVYKIRRDRASAVQTKEQYQFVYKVVSLYAMKLTGEVLE